MDSLVRRELPEFAWWVGGGTDFLGLRGPFTPAHTELFLDVLPEWLLYQSAVDEDLAPLFELPIRRLNLSGSPKSDLGITAVHTLQSLLLATDCRDRLDWPESSRVTNLVLDARRDGSLPPALEQLAIEGIGNSAVELLGVPAGVRDLSLGGKKIGLAGLEHLPHLRTLRLGASSLIDVDRLGRLLSLEDLFLSIESWVDLEQLPANVVARIRQLFILYMPHIVDLSRLAPAVELQRLCLLDTPDVASLAPLTGARRLRRLDLMGTTSVADGDLAVLAELPDLRYAAVDGRRHYSLRARDLRQWSDRASVQDLRFSELP